MSEDEIVLSIVTPVYNSQKLIEVSISSISRIKSFQIEIIVVDDCSTDLTVKIVERLATQDTRIKLIRLTKNQGVSNARNFGIKEARGIYVMFLDSDDLGNAKQIEEAIDQLVSQKDSFDFAVCNYQSEKNQNSLCLTFDGNLIDSENFVCQLQKKGIRNFRAVCWRYLICRDYLLKKNIQFPVNLRVYEDVVFVGKLITLASKICCLNKTIVKQRAIPNSLSELSCTIQIEIFFQAWNSSLLLLELAFKFKNNPMRDFLCSLVAKNLDSQAPMVLWMNRDDFMKLSRVTGFSKGMDETQESYRLLEMMKKPVKKLELLKKGYEDQLQSTRENLIGKRVILYCDTVITAHVARFLIRSEIDVMAIFDSDETRSGRIEKFSNLRVIHPGEFEKLEFYDYHIVVIHSSGSVFREIRHSLIDYRFSKCEVSQLDLSLKNIYFDKTKL